MFLTFFFLSIGVFSKEYDEILARKYLNYSGLAYCVEKYADTLTNWQCVTCREQPEYPTRIKTLRNNETNINAFLSVVQNELILSYSGTNSESMTNWIEDITMTKIIVNDLCDDCSVHKGFYGAYQSIRSDVIDAITGALERYPKTITHFSITGHSLGGALATLTASDILYNNLFSEYPMKYQMYVYGSPRAGGYNFMSFYDELLRSNEIDHYRVVHYKDPVPHLPPMTMDFYGVGYEVFYEGTFESGYEICKESVDAERGKRILYESELCSNKYYMNMNVANHLDYFDYIFDTEYNCVVRR